MNKGLGRSIVLLIIGCGCVFLIAQGLISRANDLATFSTSYRPELAAACEHATHTDYQTFERVRPEDRRWIVRCGNGTEIAVAIGQKAKP